MSAFPLNQHVAGLDGKVHVIDLVETKQNVYCVLAACADPEELTEGPRPEGGLDKKRPPLAQGSSGHGHRPVAGYSSIIRLQRPGSKDG